MASMASPPPLVLSVMGGAVTAAENNNTAERSHSSSSSSSSSSSIENVKPSIIIIILILSITVLVSVSLCLLLRHLNRRCLRHLSRSTTSTITSAAAAASHRVSPEESQTASLLDSLPVFTFSSITRRSNNDSTVSGDCAVCLSKFEPHDQLRLLPLCCHAFHAHCIDTWLASNQTCPLCRSPLYASESDLMKVLLQSSNSAAAIGSGGSDSFRLEIGSISRRQSGSESGEQRRSYSIGSFDYIVEEESEVTRNQTHRRTVSDKEDVAAPEAASEASLAAEVASGRSWLKEYVDRLSFSLSSRAMSFRSSGRFFTGSSRRSDSSGVAVDYDVEANRIGEEISEMFRWFSGV